MKNNVDNESVSIIRYGEWKWSEILYFPGSNKYIKNDYEEEYLDTGTKHIAKTELSFDEVLDAVSKFPDALLKLQNISGINLEKEISEAEESE